MVLLFLSSTIGSALFFALTFFLRKQSSKYISPSSALIVEVIAELFIISVWFLLASDGFRKGIDLQSRGITLAILSGVTASIAISLNYFAVKTGFLSKVVSVTSPSQIIFGILLGTLLLREPMTTKQLVGSILGIVSILLIVL